MKARRKEGSKVRLVGCFLLWSVFNVPLGKLAPYVLGLALGRWPHRVQEEK